jgi:hypothetical protein
LLFIVALSLRTAAVFLPVGFMMYQTYKWVESKKRVLILSISFSMCILLGVAFYLRHYLMQEIDYLRQLALTQLFTQSELGLVPRLANHFKELGEIIFNMSSNKLQIFIGNTITSTLFIGTGLGCLIIFYWAIFKHHLYAYITFWVVMAYLGIILLWPFSDCRFFIPIIPFIIIGFLVVLEQIKVLFIKKLIMTAYCVLGIAGLIYSARLSLDKDLFLSSYGNDLKLRTNYNAALGDTSIYPTNIADKNVVYLIKKYN